MTEQSNTQAPETAFAIQRIYVKDLSFETPNTPQIFQKEWKPEVEVEMNSSSQVLAENVYEVTLRVTLTTRSNDEVAYICEVSQAGIFSVVGFDDSQLQHCLAAFCPNILFPYARETIANTINKGTFQPINLEPVNFDALYINHLQQAQSQNQNQTENEVTLQAQDSNTPIQ